MRLITEKSAKWPIDRRSGTMPDLRDAFSDVDVYSISAAELVIF